LRKKESALKTIYDDLVWGKSSRRKKRKRLNKTEKKLILKSQGNKCARCHRRITLDIADFDHKRPLASGGSNSLRNYQALCPTCHRKKTKIDVRRAAKRRSKKRQTNPFGLGKLKLF
jgi:HNH endonuclease.